MIIETKRTLSHLKATGLQIPFGLSSANWQLFEPRGVPLGKACGCLCPACFAPLYAKHCLDSKVVPHFAHAPGSDCAKGYETAMHLAAKQLIDERRSLMLPGLAAKLEIRDAMGRQYYAERIVVPRGLHELDSVILEKSIEDIRPDIIIEAPGLGRVLVEIAVTHFVNAEKLEKIKTGKIPALEIDISGLRQATFDELRKVLFEEPKNSVWIFHPQVDTDEAEMLLGLAPVLAVAETAAAAVDVERRAYAEEHNRRQRELQIIEQRELAEEMAIILKERRIQDAEAKKAKHEELKRATNFKSRSESEKVLILTHRLGLKTLPSSTRLSVRGGMSFGVTNAHIWQTTLFGGLIHEQAEKGHSFVKVDYALAWLRYRFNFTPEFPDSAKIAVSECLNGFAVRGALNRSDRGYFDIAVANLHAYEAATRLKFGKISLDQGLIWTEEASWPSIRASQILGRIHAPSKHFSQGWERLSGLLSSARSCTPQEICSKYARFGISEKVIAKYLVCSGFLVLAPN